MTADGAACDKCGAFGDMPHVETWEPFPGMEDWYEVSRTGLLRSWLPWRFKPLPRLLTPHPDSHGYPTYNLDNRSYGVHRVVMLTFVGPKPDGQEIRHLDGDKMHNCLRNLAYGTKSENMYDRVKHGSHHWASRTHCSNGHEFTPENTMILRDNKRACRECKRASWRKWHAAGGQRRSA